MYLSSLEFEDLIVFSINSWCCFNASSIEDTITPFDFNSSDKLTDIGDGIKDLMYSIYKMENKIVNSIDNLTYTSQDSFKKLTFFIWRYNLGYQILLPNRNSSHWLFRNLAAYEFQTAEVSASPLPPSWFCERTVCTLPYIVEHYPVPATGN